MYINTNFILDVINRDWFDSLNLIMNIHYR